MHTRMYRCYKQAARAWAVPFILLAALLPACQSPTATAPAGTPAASADTLETFRLSRVPVHTALSLPAELLPYERAELFAKMPAYVQQMRVDIGDRVQKGQVLALLEAPELTADQSRAQALLAEKQAQSVHSRAFYERLLKASAVPGTIAPNELSAALSAAQADSAAVRAAQAHLQSLRQMNAYLTLTAPFAGVVSARHADPGVLAKPDKPLLVVESTDRFRLRVAVPERFAGALAAPSGQEAEPVQFSTQAQPDRLFQAVFSRRAGSIEPQTRTETWEYICTGQHPALKPGLFAQVNVTLHRESASFAVPTGAIVSNLEKTFVIAVRQGKAVHVLVQKGFQMGTQTEIFGQLEEGESLLLRPNDQIGNEQAVVVKGE